MAKNKKINVIGTEVTVQKQEGQDYISLTDIARYKDSANTDAIIQNWLRNRNTIELLGFWETIYNPDFKPLEFEGFRKQAGLNSFVLTPKNGLKQLVQLVSIQNQGAMVELLLIKILPLNLHHGFQSNLNCISSKNFNG